MAALLSGADRSGHSLQSAFSQLQLLPNRRFQGLMHKLHLFKANGKHLRHLPPVCVS